GGQRAFAGTSAAETMAAIIRDEPKPLQSLAPQLPVAVRWVIERCLAKDRSERYASTEDLARDLRDSEAHLSELSGGAAGMGASEATRPATRRKRLLEVAAGVLAGLVFGAMGFWLAAGRSPHPSTVPSFRRVTFQRGNVLHARFAPDGKTILYSASWEGRPAEVFSTRVDGTESRPLGLTKADLAAVSVSGELLILLKSSDLQTPGGVSTLARVSLSGGAPREIAQSVHMAEWLRGGGIVVQRHVAMDHDVLELPLGTRRLEYNGSAPRVSRDGRFIAIARGTVQGGELAVLDEAGKAVWSLKADVGQLAWHPNGELWFSRDTGQEPGLFAVARGRSIRSILKANGWVLHDIAPDGRLLMERAISRNSIRVRVNEPKERELSWLDG
ncbi:MAG TPA: hypothetical protein VFZ57_07255, partial [Thermoanaerobaculia bacterium]|nr:hypothetical protein [Thermoanaerobaculia bacterium]